MKHEDSLKDLNLQIDIPCLNCDQLIDYKDVGEIIIAVKLINIYLTHILDRHSRICTRVKSRVMLLEKPKTSNTAMRVEQRGKALYSAI